MITNPSTAQSITPRHYENSLLQKFQWPGIMEQIQQNLKTAKLLEISVLDRRYLYGVCTVENVKILFFRGKKNSLHVMMLN